MNTTTKKFCVMGAIIVGLAGIGLLGRMSFAQDTPPQSPVAERYRLVVAPANPASNGAQATVFLLDTQTGRCWYESLPFSKWNNATPPGLVNK